jgi:hypothetical protein
MQFGIEICYFMEALAQYAYAQWAGLYENLGRYVYVNRGFDFNAYPVEWIMPEITVIAKKKLRISLNLLKNATFVDY